MDLTKDRIMLVDLDGESIEVTLLEDGEIKFANHSEWERCADAENVSLPS